MIGVPRSNTVLNLFRIAVAAQGMNPDTDVMTEELSQSPQRLAALQTGQMAAAVLAPVYLEQAEQAGAHALPEVQLPLVPTSGLAASLTTLESPSATAEGMVRASLRAVQLMRQNPEDTVTLISDHLGVSRPAAERAYTLAIDAFSPEGIIPEQALQVVIDLVRASTGSRTTVTPAQLADFSLARRVAQP